jgi:very-short-patch-repair endonuclease
LCSEATSGTTKDVNEAEALEIASLLLACSEREEYSDQSFGIIALRGSADSRGADPQTDRIARLVREAIGGPAEWERFAVRHRFKCGVPAAFQGDERDVVFISVGDDPASQAGGGPLRLTSESSVPGSQYKKRLNVAVSRARNQVWIVHSFRHFEAELQEADIRRKLLEFAYAPNKWLESTRAENPKAESPFEQAVYADLVRLGFTVIPQVPVGHYRIDLVVEDEDARVALECDGDAYHQDAAADLARQLVLERCGWKFLRIRGSEYYRNPEAVIDRVVRELEKLGVTPGYAQPERTEPEGALLECVRARASEIQNTLRGGHSYVPRPAVLSTEKAYESEAQELDEAEDSFEDAPSGRRVPFKTSGVLTAESRAVSQGAGSMEFNLEEYAEFSETDFDDPKVLPIGRIQSDLIKIVAVEGPATERRIIDRYRVAVGYGRLKGPTRDRVERALREAAKRGHLRARSDYPGAKERVYALPSQPEVRLRQRGARNFDDIPMAEIVEVLRRVMVLERLIGTEGVYREVLSVFDLKRLTEQAKARLEQAMALAKVAGVDGKSPSAGLDRLREDEDEEAGDSYLPSHELKPPTPLKDKQGNIIRVRVLGASGQEVVAAGTVVGRREQGEALEWAVLVDETNAVRKFLSPPATLKRLREGP